MNSFFEKTFYTCKRSLSQQSPHGKLFLSLVILLIIYPFCLSTEGGERFIILISSVTVLTGSAAVARHKNLFRFTLASGFVVIIMVLLQLFFGETFRNPTFIEFLGLMAMISFWSFNTMTILSDVMKAGPVTEDRIMGAISVYLLMGMNFFLLYVTAYSVNPESFLITTDTRTALLQDLFFFSFITQTSVGYGNIVPTSALTQSISILQAIVGIFYVAIIIARLVGARLAIDVTRDFPE